MADEDEVPLPQIESRAVRTAFFYGVWAAALLAFVVGATLVARAETVSPAGVALVGMAPVVAAVGMAIALIIAGVARTPMRRRRWWVAVVVCVGALGLGLVTLVASTPGSQPFGSWLFVISGATGLLAAKAARETQPREEPAPTA